MVLTGKRVRVYMYPSSVGLFFSNARRRYVPVDIHYSEISYLWIVTKFIFTQLENSTFNSCIYRKVQVGKDQEKAQSEKDSHSKNRGGKKTN